MIQPSYIRPAILNYNTTLEYTLSNNRVGILVGVFLVKFYLRGLFYKNKAQPLTLCFLPSLTFIPVQPYNYIPSILLLSFIIIFIIIYLKPIFTSFYKELIFGFFFAAFSFIAPTFQYFFMLFVSTVLLILTFPYLDYYFPVRKHLAVHLYQILDILGISLYLSNIYLKFFNQEKKTFLVQTIFLYVLCILYTLISKYLFLTRENLWLQDKSLLLLFYILLLLCTIMVYYRLLLSASIVIHNISSTLLKTEDLPETQDSSNGAKNFSLFTYKKNITNQYPNASVNVSRFRLLGFGIGICTLCIGSYAAYQQRLQTISSQIQAEEMVRQNDLEEVSQGLMTRDDYLKKHSNKK